VTIGGDVKNGRRWPDSARTLVWSGVGVAMIPLCFLVFHGVVALLAMMMSHELERRTVEWENGGYSRPVLRGIAQPGNAADAHLAAIEEIGPTNSEVIDWSVEDQDDVRRGTPKADLAAFAVTKSGGLAALRKATQHTRAWRPWDVRGLAETPIHYPRSSRALSLLLTLASREPGSECLRMAADGLRTMWDIAPSGGRVGQMIGCHAAKLALPFAATCLRRARPGDLAPAAREFRAILRDAPPFGLASYADDLAMAWLLNRSNDRYYPRTFANILTAKDRREVLKWQFALLHGADLLRKVTPDRYPWAWQEAAKDVAGLRMSWKRRHLEYLLSQLERFMNRDREAQALMRAMVLGLGFLSGSPETLAADPLLRDPFSGSSLHWRRATATQPAAVYSVGLDGKDDGFAEGSDDVGLTFPTVGEDLPLVELRPPSTSALSPL
jgi:hypothetical protein